MKIDYSYHYKKFNSDTPQAIAEATQYYQRVLGGCLPQNKNAEILDVGCGMGLALAALRELGFKRLSGIDADAGQVASCQAKGLDVIQSLDSVTFLRSHPAKYDFIVACDLIEHIPAAEQLDFAAALATALKSGGMLLATTPNASSLLASRYRHLDWTHQTAFTEHSLDFLFHNAGFREIRVTELEAVIRPRLWWLPTRRGRHWWAFRFFRGWRRLQMMAELGRAGRTVPLSPNLLMVARKP